jgi:hypothetical protein
LGVGSDPVWRRHRRAVTLRRGAYFLLEIAVLRVVFSGSGHAYGLGFGFRPYSSGPFSGDWTGWVEIVAISAGTVLVGLAAHLLWLRSVHRSPDSSIGLPARYRPAGQPRSAGQPRPAARARGVAGRARVGVRPPPPGVGMGSMEAGITAWGPGTGTSPHVPYFAPTPGRVPVDWEGLVASVAIRLEEALGPGFYAQGAGTTLLLRHADDSRMVPLERLLQPPPPDPTARAMRACVKMMDEAQMFKMQQLRQPWPARPHRDDSTPETTLARPYVHLANYELHFTWVDQLGPVLQMPSVPFVEGHPEPDGPIRAR